MSEPTSPPPSPDLVADLFRLADGMVADLGALVKDPRDDQAKIRLAAVVAVFSAKLAVLAAGRPVPPKE